MREKFSTQTREAVTGGSLNVMTVVMIRKWFLAGILLWGISSPVLGLDGLKLEKDSQGSKGGVESYTFLYEDIQGYHLKPSGGGPFPAVVVNHGKGNNAGGFTRQYGSILAESGFVTIACDLTHAGKTDTGQKTWAASQENADRILKCIKILESLSYVDAEKLCMLGHSMGAFATVGACTQTDKIKAAAIGAGGLRDRDGLDTEANVPKITAPFLILHGDKDPTVKIELGIKFKEAMDKNQKTVEMKIIKGGDHKILTNHKDELFPLIIAFFRRYLDGA